MKKLNDDALLVLTKNALPNLWCAPLDPDWRSLDFDPHGWFSEDNERTLTKLLAEGKIGRAIEIGSWIGKSTRFLAEHCRELVIAIDTWKGSREHHRAGRDDIKHLLGKLLPQFLANCQGFENICPIRSTSSAAASLKLPKVGLIYIDGDHSYESVWHDVYDYFEFVEPGGIICGDDWLLSSVRDAVRDVADNCACHVEMEGNFWWLEQGDPDDFRRELKASKLEPVPA
jgi:hypothetical protein